MPIDAARKYLTPLPAGHFLRRRLEEPAALATEAASDPQGTLAAILESYGVPMAVPEIKAALAGVVAEEQWTSWWNRAKKNQRILASGSGTRVQYRLASGAGAEEEIRAEFAAAALPQQLDWCAGTAGVAASWRRSSARRCSNGRRWTARRRGRSGKR